MRILVVEDETRLAKALGQILAEGKYIVDVVHDGTDGLLYALDGQYDLILLDVMLPGKGGFDIVRSIRAAGLSVPVLMLTAREETSDKVKGLDAGADDYMTKPFAPDELLARVRALLRRQGDILPEEMLFMDISLNVSTHELSCESKSIHLSFKEFEVMRFLISNPGIIVPKEDLLVKIWGSLSDAEDNNVEVYISFLRKKLLFLKSSVTIGTVRKVGYRLEENSND